MEGHWIVSSEPSRIHVRWARESSYLFATSHWGHIIEALGATPMYAWNPEIELGFMLPVFTRYGIKVGFLGFPVLGQSWDDFPISRARNTASHLMKALGLDLIRFTESMQKAPHLLMTSARPEVWIEDLQSWSADSTKRLRRDLSFARRSSQGIHIETTCDNAKECHKLYETTVKAHGGKVRYNLGYFSRLTALADMHEGLEVFAALGDSGAMHGFAVLGVHGSTAYYLHGAVDLVGRHCGVSDLLLEILAMRAREMGALKLSLMSSPWKQAGLVRFKRKWGTDNGLAATHDVAAGLVGRCTRALLNLWSHGDRVRAGKFVQISQAMSQAATTSEKQR